MPGSRLLPAEQRSALRPAPTTSRLWRVHVLVRSWCNRHRHQLLAPLLVVVPPVGVAVVWAGATRPGHTRRWLTAAALVWSLVLLLSVVLLTLPGAAPADAGDAPRPLTRAAAPTTPAPAVTRPGVDASAAAAVRADAPVIGAGVDAAAVADGDRSTAGSDDPDPSSSGATEPTPAGEPTAAAAPPAASVPTPTPQRPHASPTAPRTTPAPPRTPTTPPTTRPAPPVATALPFSRCSTEGAHAVSPRGVSLRCFRTPIGLYWLWG